MLLASAKVESNDKPVTSQSPQQRLFHSQLQYVEEIQSQLPTDLYGDKLGELVATQYLQVSSHKTTTVTSLLFEKQPNTKSNHGIPASHSLKKK